MEGREKERRCDTDRPAHQSHLQHLVRNIVLKQWNGNPGGTAGEGWIRAGRVLRIAGRLSGDGPADIGRRRRDLHGPAGFGPEAVGTGGFPQVWGFPVGSGECHRRTPRRPRCVARGGPDVVAAEALHPRARDPVRTRGGGGDPGRRPGSATGRRTGGGIWWRTFSRRPGSSGRSRRGATGPTGASRPGFTPSPAWSPRHDCQQALIQPARTQCPEIRVSIVISGLTGLTTASIAGYDNG